MGSSFVKHDGRTAVLRNPLSSGPSPHFSPDRRHDTGAAHSVPEPRRSPLRGRSQHGLTGWRHRDDRRASLDGRPPKFDDRTWLYDDRCRLQAQLVDHRRQAEGGQRAIEPPVDGVGVVVEVECVAEFTVSLRSVVGLAETGAASALQVAVEAGDFLPRAGSL